MNRPQFNHADSSVDPAKALAGLDIGASSAEETMPSTETIERPADESEPEWFGSGIRSAAAIAPGIKVGGVVVGGDFQGLGIVRSLGRRGIPTCVIDDEQSISRYSRYTTHAVRVRNLRDENQIVDALLGTGHRLGLHGWVLYPTREELVAALSRNRSELSRWFRVPTPEWNTVRWAWDKRNTYRLAEALGIPTPRTWYPRNEEDLEDIDAAPPLVLKPAIKEHFVYATKAKAWRVNSRQELTNRLRQAVEIAGAGEIMVQELIPGDGRSQYAYCAFVKEGRAIGSMIARRRRQHPPEFGRASTFVESVDVPQVEKFAQRFLQAIGYYGLVEVEFKWDQNDGQYKLLDVNARTWAYHTLGPRAGVDFCFLLFADQLGQPVQTQRAGAQVSWIRLATDLPTAMIEIMAGRLSWREYLRTVRRANIESVFSRDDPMPGVMEIALIPYLAVKRGF